MEQLIYLMKTLVSKP